MNIKLENPKDIYDKINIELLKLVTSLSSESSDESLNKAQEDARDKIVALQVKLKNKLEELERNSEWNTFTIAFYGETGAGKSTLVETLRILLNEPTKLENRDAFRKLKHSYDQAIYQLPEIEEKLSTLDKDLEQLNEQLNSLTEQYQREESQLEQEFEVSEKTLCIEHQKAAEAVQARKSELSTLKDKVAELQRSIVQKKAQASLWQKIVNIFKKLPEEHEFLTAISNLPKLEDMYVAEEAKLADAQQKLSETRSLREERHADFINKFDLPIKALERDKGLVEQTKRLASQQLESASKQVSALELELNSCADGEIIGDGRADFTRKTLSYRFNIEQCDFNLLDVPGIEGKEGLVVNEIEKAVQSAHAVFYVTNKAAPPQTGDSEREGTLEKIKKHLGTQTEVWSIFNKKITNPKFAFKNTELLTDDEQASLVDMDKKMAEQLGRNYQGSFPLTALTAFIASTDYFAPNSDMLRKRNKFLEDFSAESLLERSQLSSFIQLLKSELLLNGQSKIKKANFYKVKGELERTTHELDDIEKIYKVAAEGVCGISESSCHQLQTSYEFLNSQLHSKGHDVIRKAIQETRNYMYRKIDRNISNDQFKTILETQIKHCVTEMQGQLPSVIKDTVKEFENSVEDIFKRFSELSAELLAAAGQLGLTKLELKINIKIDMDNGVNKGALFGGLIGAVLAPFTGGTSLWLSGAAILTSIVGIAKGIGSFFSSDYKMSEQRNAADTNLRNVEDQLKKALQNSLDKGKSDMQASIDKLDNALKAPAKQAVKTKELLERSNQSLKLLSKQIDHIGEC
ncbi:hypothetical protein OLI68_001132 [Vibrio cholerae]|nr:hypothetical protein [Vibrio cholerae]